MNTTCRACLKFTENGVRLLTLYKHYHYLPIIILNCTGIKVRVVSYLYYFFFFYFSACTISLCYYFAVVFFFASVCCAVCFHFVHSVFCQYNCDARNTWLFLSPVHSPYLSPSPFSLYFLLSLLFGILLFRSANQQCTRSACLINVTMCSVNALGAPRAPSISN